ncbi:MAG: hypothetical protein KF812_00390 [Fimbriimonadaceae bacterium]|nr:hypothetical protein [Fimbriimonadaceae bacterium]
MSDSTERICRLIDGDTDANEGAAIHQERQSNPDVEATYHWMLFVKQVVSTKCTPKENDPLLATCMERIAAIEKSKRTETFVTRHAWALTGALAVVIVGGTLAQRSFQGQGLGDTQVASIVGGAAPARNTQDLDSIRAADAFRQLNQSLGSVHISPAEELRAVSMEKGAFEGRAFARLVVRDSQGEQFYIVAIENASGKLNVAGKKQGRYTIGQMNGLNTVSWCNGGVSLVVAGDSTPNRLVELADSIRADH